MHGGRGATYQPRSQTLTAGEKQTLERITAKEERRKTKKENKIVKKVRKDIDKGKGDSSSSPDSDDDDDLASPSASKSSSDSDTKQKKKRSREKRLQPRATTRVQVRYYGYEEAR